MGVIKKIYQFYRQSGFARRKYTLTWNRKIAVGSNNQIYPGCKIVTNQGGKILIGSDNEILFGVCIMTYGGEVVIGDRCSINPYTVIYGPGKGTYIGNDVLIAGHCLIISASHIYENILKPINQQGYSSKGIVIENNVWIGSG